MTEFMMIFRTEKMDNSGQTPEEMQAIMQIWQDWIGGIAAQGKFVSTNALNSNGKTVTSEGVVTNGPYAELKEIVGGYIIVKAESLDDAVTLSEGCPILAIPTGKVEVRGVQVFDS
ncbi:YciI family protein [Maribacter sp. 2307UL18-2]|uniref:YciI family protein n=1 Tax=Maribacter sp. 2307UL18-2 TaxID=3386274 RepID=UPI0039BC845B